MFPEFSARTEPARVAHPGTVTFVGTDGSQQVEPADRVPEWLKFAPDANGSAVPVVRVVRVATDRGYALRSYNAAGQLLWVGLAVPTAPAERAATRFTPRNRFASEPTGWF